ncbi:kinase-like domain-containing protein [Mycena sp. CBHHK59/15]|nr:kinase-like domain-containing protein [Mycena sp. CBHHK59/15]
MSTTDDWIYPSAFNNSSLPALSSNTDGQTSSSRPSNSSSGSYTGQIASFVFLVAGLEASLKDDPVLFDVNTSFLSPRAPIGSGASFIVERAEWRARSSVGLEVSNQHGWGKFVALKYVRRREERTEYGNWKQVLLEIRALLHEPIRYHPNVVRLLGLSWGASQGMRTVFPMLVLECAEFGTLAQLQANADPLPFLVKKKLCHDVSKGLAILHACGIVHGDLKHQNVLIFRNKVKDADVMYTAKVADFGGSAMDIQDDKERFLLSGTPPFNAPEAHYGLGGEGLKRTDVYSLGLLVWSVVLDGNNPFHIPALVSLTPERIEDLKKFDELLPIVRESVRDHTVLHLSDDEMEILYFVFDNTIQAISEHRSLKKTTAALQVRDLSEMHDLLASVEQGNETEREAIINRAPGRHGVSRDSMGVWLAKVSYDQDYDYQSSGPGARPKLSHPNPGELLFNPERLKRLLDWSLQVEIVRDLENATAAPRVPRRPRFPRLLLRSTCFNVTSMNSALNSTLKGHAIGFGKLPCLATNARRTICPGLVLARPPRLGQHWTSRCPSSAIG